MKKTLDERCAEMKARMLANRGEEDVAPPNSATMDAAKAASAERLKAELSRIVCTIENGVPVFPHQVIDGIQKRETPRQLYSDEYLNAGSYDSRRSVENLDLFLYF